MCLGINAVLDLALESGHCYLYSRSVLELLELGTLSVSPAGFKHEKL